MKNYSNQIANTILEAQQKQDKLSHAYLFIGEHEQNDFALYAAQAILCQAKKIGACQQCSSCLRVLDHQHADFVFLSGKEKSIKKEDILKLQELFQQSSLESSGHQVYIIEDVDNASISAMNSLLKFLEEPKPHVTALLTSSSEHRVIETIKSRCLIIKLKEATSEALFNELIEQEYDLIDAHYLSKLFPSLKAIEEDKQFHHVVDFTKEFIQYLNHKQLSRALVSLQAQTTRRKTMDREGFIMFLDILSLSFSSQSHDISAIQTLISSNLNKTTILEIIVDIKDRIRPGVNLGLLVDQFAYQMSKEKLYD